MRAAVFVRRSGARGAGHVGWAFECGDGTFDAGSIENPRHTLLTRPQDMGFWTIRTSDPVAPMRQRAYTALKLITVDPGDPVFAWHVVTWLSQYRYDVFGHNCMNATYDVLRAFGVAGLPAPAHHWEPNHWYNHIRGQEYQIGASDVRLEVRAPDRQPIELALPDAECLLTDPLIHIAPAMPPWRAAHTPEGHALRQAIAAAPPMPAERAPAAKGLLASIRRLLG